MNIGGERLNQSIEVFSTSHPIKPSPPSGVYVIDSTHQIQLKHNYLDALNINYQCHQMILGIPGEDGRVNGDKPILSIKCSADNSFHGPQQQFFKGFPRVCQGSVECGQQEKEGKGYTKEKSSHAKNSSPHLLPFSFLDLPRNIGYDIFITKHQLQKPGMCFIKRGVSN